MWETKYEESLQTVFTLEEEKEELVKKYEESIEHYKSVSVDIISIEHYKSVSVDIVNYTVYNTQCTLRCTVNFFLLKSK